MKRLHVHVAVPDLSASIRFYSTLFGAEPVKVKPDYAKWILDDPRVNFAISARGQRAPGVDHVGIQVDSRAELDALAGRPKAAGEHTLHEEAVSCCYAQGDKDWVSDPSGVRWETFYTFDDATTYGENPKLEMAQLEVGAASAACCGAAAEAKPLAAAQERASGCCG